MMDSLGQGFIVFNKYGKCLDIYTRASLEMFQMNPSEKEIDDVLMLSDQEKEQFSMWRTAVFEETLPFDALVDLAPKWYLNKQDKNISLEYYLLRSELNEITNVVLVATDQTDKIKAQVELEIEKSNAQMILKILKSKLQFNSFMNDYKNPSLEQRETI